MLLPCSSISSGCFSLQDKVFVLASSPQTIPAVWASQNHWAMSPSTMRKNAFTLVTELNDFQFHVVQRQGLFQPALELWCQVFHTVSALSSLAIWTSLKKRSHLVFLLKNVVVALWNGLIILIRCGKSFGVHVYRLNLKGAGHTCLARFIPQQTTLRERREEWQIQLNTSLGLLPSEDISSFILELDSLMSR